jgi:ubiquinone/menaquinone biosynthesis C-methylase UbiE
MTYWLERVWSRWFGDRGGGDGLGSLARQSGDPFRESPYYEVAEPYMDELWRTLIWPRIEGLDRRSVMDLAAGHGRNSVRLAAVAESLIMVDINRECLDACRARLGDDPRFQYIRTDGYSLKGVTSGSVSLVYTFDAMVHFDPEVVRSYLPEIRRVLESGGHGFCHHSNNVGNQGGDFRDSPHWRNYMSLELFGSMCDEAGLEVVRSESIDWGRGDDLERDLDGLTVFRKL